MFKQQSLSFHVVSKTFITQNYLSVISVNILHFIAFIALVLQILKQELIEVNTILKNNIVPGIIMMTCTNALPQTNLTKNVVFWWQLPVEDFE